MQCEEWDDANSELFKESHDEAVHKNSYKSKLYELISASLKVLRFDAACGREGCGGGCAAIYSLRYVPFLPAPAVILSEAKNLGTCR